MSTPTAPRGPRLKRPERCQMRMQLYSLDQLVPLEHPARQVWAFVEGLDLSRRYAAIRAVSGRAGRDAVDPKVLLALWLYATVDGVGSARALGRLCRDHAVYRWLCGEISVNYHTLSDFRSGETALLEELLTQSVAALLYEGLVTLERVAQDGMRVRASAGASSFRRRETLEACQAAAQEQVAALRAEADADPAAGEKRRQAARQRAAAERAERVAQALAALPAVEAQKQKSAKKGEARVSTTDPEARVMKMGDGGFRPAHNVQFATDTASQVITGVAVVNSGSDGGQLAPMVAQHEERYGRRPAEVLVDGGFATKEDIEAVSAAPPGTTVYAPVQKPRVQGRDPYAPLPGDSAAVAAWRARMGTAAAKAIYKERAATAECVNALSRNRGLQQFLVRGLVKVTGVALLYALAHNLLRGAKLRAQAALVAAATT